MKLGLISQDQRSFRVCILVDGVFVPKDPEQLTESEEGWERPEDDARAIVESQMLS